MRSMEYVEMPETWKCDNWIWIYNLTFIGLSNMTQKVPNWIISI